MILRILETSLWTILVTTGLALALGDFVIPDLSNLREKSEKINTSLQQKQQNKSQTPNQPLESGRQSTIRNEEFKARISAELNAEKSPKTVKQVYEWIKDKKNFEFEDSEGKTIGQRTIDQIYEDKTTGGCHDYALLFVGIMRRIGIPAVMVDTMDIGWAKNFKEGKNNGYIGHVFAEVYVDNKWSLIDPTNGDVIIDYNPKDPVIPISHHKGSEGYYVMKKGLDSWDYGIKSDKELNELMESQAKKLDLSNLEIPSYVAGHF